MECSLLYLLSILFGNNSNLVDSWYLRSSNGNLLSQDESGVVIRRKWDSVGERFPWTILCCTVEEFSVGYDRLEELILSVKVPSGPSPTQYDVNRSRSSSSLLLDRFYGRVKTSIRLYLKPHLLPTRSPIPLLLSLVPSLYYWDPPTSG